MAHLQSHIVAKVEAWCYKQRMVVVAEPRRPPTPSCVKTWLILLLTALPIEATSSPPVVLTDKTDMYVVGSQLEILEDQTRPWALGDVVSSAMAARYRPSPSNRVELGSAKPASWFRLQVSNEASSRKDWLLVIRASEVDHIGLFIPSGPDGSFRVSRTGAALPFASREIPDRRYVFYLPDTAGSPVNPVNYTVYLRLENSGPVVLYPTVLSMSSFQELRQKEMFLFGIFYGTMLLALAVHLVMFLLTREPSYIHYGHFIFVCVVILALVEGLIQQYVWPRHLVLPVGTLLLLLLGISVPLLLIFGSSFLQSKKLLPRLHTLIQILLFLALSWFLLYPWLADSILIRIYYFLGSLSLLTIVVGGLLSWRRGHRPARYFSIAWLVFLGVFVLAVNGVPQFMSDDDDTASVTIALHVSVALTSLVFALALADRVKWQREQAAMERDRLFAELEAKNAELERFTYSVSHDLKSPLVTIMGFLGFLKRDIAKRNEERITEDISRIEKAARSMGQLLDDLLALSRIGRVVHAPEKVSLNTVIQEALERSAGRIEKAGAQILVAPDLPSVWCDRKRVTEVFQNLIDNAVKFAGNRADTCVEIGARTDGDRVHCYVKDNGRGIAPRHHKRIFELFERLSAEEEGTGIGLALVKRIVEEHRGQIRVESQGSGHGCTFWITLPATQG